MWSHIAIIEKVWLLCLLAGSKNLLGESLCSVYVSLGVQNSRILVKNNVMKRLGYLKSSDLKSQTDFDHLILSHRLTFKAMRIFPPLEVQIGCSFPQQQVNFIIVILKLLHNMSLFWRCRVVGNLDCFGHVLLSGGTC